MILLKCSHQVILNNIGTSQRNEVRLSGVFHPIINEVKTYPILPHEFITKDEEGNNKSSEKETIVFLNNITDNQPHKTNILINFGDAGHSCVRVDSEYKIYKKDMHEDFSLLKHSGVFYVDTFLPFTHKFDIYCENYMSIQKMKVFPVGKLIKINLTLSNELKTDIVIDRVEIYNETDDVNIECLFTNEVKEISHIAAGTEYILPLLVKANAEFSGSIGCITLYWKDRGLLEFDPTMTNTIEFTLPEIDVKKYDIEMTYEVQNIVAEKSAVSFKVNLKNDSQEFRKLLFLIDNSPNFVLTGNVKKKLMLYPEEEKQIVFDMIPLSYGKLKLPPFKVMEFPLNTNYENKVYSIYYLPDYLLVKGHK
jgi:hypothetical protein